MLSSPFFLESGAISPTVVVTCMILFAAFTIVRAKKYYNEMIKPLLVVPGPPRHPILGFLSALISNWDQWPMACVGFSKEFQHKTWGGPSPGHGFLFTDSPANCQYMLKDNFDCFVKGDDVRSIFREWLGNGIFGADGELWETHRKLASRLFSRNQLRYAATVVNDYCQIILQQFDDKLGNQEKFSIDLRDLFLRLTMDASSMITFGVDLGSVRAGKQPEFANAFDELQVLCLERFMDPFYAIERVLRLTSRERRIRKCKKIVDNFCAVVVQTRRRQVNEGNTIDQHDLLSLFLEHSKEEDQGRADEELRDVITNFLVAGRDTTAAALSWAFYELSKHPDVVEKIVAEVKNICFGTDGHPDYSFDNMNKLSYAHAVIMEVLRLHPPVPNDCKVAVRATTLPDGTYVPAGTLVSYLPLAMGRNTEIWGDDAEEFKPERFLSGKEPSPFRFIAFNAGPRMCLGKSQALMTIKLVFANLLPRYVFVDKVGHSGKMHWTMVQQMKGGFVVEVTNQRLTYS